MIIPTVFATSKKQFNKRFNKILPLSKNIQIDFMDGKFVSSKSLSPSQIPNLRKYKKNFEAHLMLYAPEKYLILLKNKGFKKIIFHIETTNHPEDLINKIKNLKLKVFIAIAPETKITEILPYINKVDGILFLGVHPGKEHQYFIPLVYKRISNLRKTNKKIKIQVDGGVNSKIIIKLAKLRVNYVNSGSYISESLNSKEAFKKLNFLFLKHKK